MKALSTAATGMLAQQMNVEVISNNIANINTTSFKRSRAEFQDLLYQTVERVGSNTSAENTVAPAGIQVGVGVRAAGVYRITEQGPLQNTGNPLDLAINGRGFFEVQLPNGILGYSRAGSFQIDQNGLLVTNDGFQLVPAITIPPNATSVNINEQGSVDVFLPGQPDPANVGQINLSMFPNEVGLEAVGNNQFQATQASGQAVPALPGVDGRGAIFQGFLENSNVNAVQEISNLITAQRSYELNSQVIQAADEMLNTANQLK